MRILVLARTLHGFRGCLTPRFSYWVLFGLHANLSAVGGGTEANGILLCSNVVVIGDFHKIDFKFSDCRQLGQYLRAL